MKAVVIENLSKIFPGGKKAVNHVNLALEQGEVFGFLGPNGAGKTTTVKILNGMLAPSEGNCRVFQIDPEKNPDKAHDISGVVTEHAQMYDTMTGIQNLIFYGSVFGINRVEIGKRAEDLLEKLGLMDAKNQKLSAYSTGMRQRLSLARALIHQPKVLFLDEPTSGLDPESAKNVNQMIHGLAKDENVTIFLCTHQLRYAQEICTRYGLIDEGELLAAGTLEELRSQVLSGMTVRIKASKVAGELPYRKVGEQEFETDVQSEEEIPHIVSRIVDSGGSIYHVSAKRPSLEDIYFALTAGRKEARQ